MNQTTIPEFTLVVGVDAKHLQQLAMVWPTWLKHKPSFRTTPFLIFRDRDQVMEQEVREVMGGHRRLTIVEWPPKPMTFAGNNTNKWTNAQRYKMLAGFVHVPAMHVKTPYWLKVDTDTVATGQADWIDPNWFWGTPAIISQRWGFTKPADQMMALDRWVDRSKWKLPLWASTTEPLNLIPMPGWSRVKHGRIISWCGFFLTSFTRSCAQMANDTCGDYQLPVSSQDGYTFYVAERAGLGVLRVGMKSKGWQHRSNFTGIRQAVRESMQ